MANSKSIKSIVSANENKIGPNNRKLPTDEGGKSCDSSTTNQNAATCIIECNDRKGGKIVKSITNCQLRESDFNSILNFPNTNFQMTIINLKKFNFCYDNQKLPAAAAVRWKWWTRDWRR